MNRPFIVAEMSANHLGDLDRAMKIVEAAADAGADAIKLQTWTPGAMCISPDYRLGKGPWAGYTLKRLYEIAHTPWEWHKPIFDYARILGLVPFSAAFDRESVDFLETLGVDRHKVASFELVDLPLIRYMASKGKPMILSTGMATEKEVWEAMSCAYEVTDAPVTLLKCTSAYPADATDANLRTIELIMGSGWGLSDHTIGVGVACAAAGLGAVMIEKHLTLARSDGGPDAGFSMEPHELKQLVVECRRAAAARGRMHFGPGPSESTELRRSLWVTRDVAAGEPLRLGFNVATARPALGMSPATDLEGQYAVMELKAGQPLQRHQITERYT